MTLQANQRSRRQACQPIFLSLFLLFTCFARAVAQSAEDSNGDTQLWPDVQISFRMNQRVALNFFGTLREGRNLRRPVSEQLGAGINFSLNKYVSVTPWYRFVANQPVVAASSREHRFFTDVTIRVPLGRGVTLVDRTRAELRNIDGNWSRRYRNRLQFEKSINLNDRKITPYIAGERFYSDRFHIWTRTFYLFGARIPLHQHLTLDAYYMRQIDVSVRPGHLHIIGTMLRFDF